jgi:hypothetical protein
MAVSMNFICAPPQKIVPTDLPAVILKNSSIVKQFFANFSAEAVSSGECIHL